VLLVISLAALSGRGARAEGEPSGDGRLFVRLAVGPAFTYERWHPTGGSPGATYIGWGPTLDLAIGRRLGPGWRVAGDLQLAGIIDRDEGYLGGSYPLQNTLFLLETASVLADYTPRSHPRFDFGGALGVLAATEIDTQAGSTATDWGWAASFHVGVRRALSAKWSLGLMGRLTVYRFGSDLPAPTSTATGLLPVLLVTFTRG
jgi:hypothetical protein